MRVVWEGLVWFDMSETAHNFMVRFITVRGSHPIFVIDSNARPMAHPDGEDCLSGFEVAGTWVQQMCSISKVRWHYTTRSC
jgi:hypothetical protein